MNDRDFLIWIHCRLTEIHGENSGMDYMFKLRSIIEATPAGKITPNCTNFNNIEALIASFECECDTNGDPLGR